MSSQEVDGFAREVRRWGATLESLQAAVPPEQPQLSSTSRKVTWKPYSSFPPYCYSMGTMLLCVICLEGQHLREEILCTIVHYIFSVHSVEMDEQDRTRGNWTLLHCCAMCGRDRLANILIRRGADVNVQTSSSRWTPLHLAVDCNKINVVKVMLSHDSDGVTLDTTLRDDRGRTALDLARKEKNEGCVQLLVDHESAKQPLAAPAAQETAVQATAVQATAVPPAVQATAVQATAVQATAVPATAVQATAVPATAVQAAAVQATAVQATAVQATAVQATAVQATAVQATAPQATAVQETAEVSSSAVVASQPVATSAEAGSVATSQPVATSAAAGSLAASPAVALLVASLLAAAAASVASVASPVAAALLAAAAGVLAAVALSAAASPVAPPVASAVAAAVTTDEDEEAYGDPFKQSAFITDISPWLDKLPAAKFRKLAQVAGFFSDLQQIEDLKRIERQDGTRTHNEELVNIVSSEEQAGYIKLVKVIKCWGKYPDKIDKMNQLLPRRARV